MNAIQFFIDAHNQAEQDQARYEAEEVVRKTKETRAAFTKKFGFEPDEVNGRIVTLEGGVKLMCLTEDYSYAWKVAGKCPTCGEEVWSNEVYSADGIGKLIVNFKTNYNHYCPVQVIPQETIEQRLTGIIRELIQEAVNG